MVTKIFNEEKVKKSPLYIKLEETDGKVKIVSVDENGDWRKDICYISNDGIYLYECADEAGFDTDVFGRIVILNPEGDD